MTEKYKAMTTEDFYTYLHKVVNSMNTQEILGIEGVYELLSEKLNNEVLEGWEKDHVQKTTVRFGFRAVITHPLTNDPEQYIKEVVEEIFLEMAHEDADIKFGEPELITAIADETIAVKKI